MGPSRTSVPLSAALNEAYEAGWPEFPDRARRRWLCRYSPFPEFAGDIARLKGVRQQSKLSQAALETLAIIAYRQPILRADLESIRGVACGEVLRGLMDRRLARIAGRAEVVGRPMLYGTTREFLEVFVLANLDDLPQAKELRPTPAVKPKPSSSKATDDRVRVGRVTSKHRTTRHRLTQPQKMKLKSLAEVVETTPANETDD